MKRKKNLLGNYSKFISDNTFDELLINLAREYRSRPVLPDSKSIFRAFQVCPHESLNVVFLGQDPYPQKGYATGLAFANPQGTIEISPSLKKIIERVEDDYLCHLPFNHSHFDITLESWAKQGVLLLNSALTVEENRIGSHTEIWYNFIKEFLKGMSEINPGMIYVLLGNQAKSFKPFIKNGHILQYNHPAYYARIDARFDCNCFTEINKILKKNNNVEIEWIKLQKVF